MNFEYTIETISGISALEIGKLGLLVLGPSIHCFQKRSTLDNSPSRGLSFYPIISERFQVLKIRVSLTNPRSARYGTRTDTSNRYDLIFCYLHLRFSFQNDLSHQLDEKLSEAKKLPTMEV